VTRSTKPSKTRRRQQPPAAHLLVLECQREKLAEQELDFGSRIATVLKTAYPDKRIASVPTSMYRDLGPTLAEVFVEYGCFRSILIVGHSNSAGIQLTNDVFLTWSGAGRWVAKFEPRVLFFAACEAGRSEMVRSLFEAIPTLREVYASPVRLYVEQTAPLAALIALFLEGPRIDSDTSSVIRTLNFAMTRGQIFRWTREEVGPGQEITNKMWDYVASLLQF